MWIEAPPELEPDDASLHTFEHALVNALPMALLCDRRDIGSSSEGNRVYVYDFAEGGIGLAEKAFHVLEVLLERAATLLRDCPCSDGCPSCMHLAGCPRGNGVLDKVGGIALLEGRGVGGAHVADRLLREPGSGGAGVARDTSERRRGRYRAIADADLRERYGARPAWLEVGGLAQSQAEGLVIVRSIGRGMAEVQTLSGSDPHWVSIKDLSPPRPT
jgi:hypothetical protein